MMFFWMVGCAHPVVDVGLRAVVVGPQDWDGMAVIGAVAKPGVVTALGSANPLLGAVGGQVVGGLLDGMAPPDIAGVARVYVDGAATGAAVSVPEIDDSFLPVWTRGQVSLANIPLRSGYAVGLSLVDVDMAPLNPDDPVADVLIPDEELRAALRASRRAGEPTPYWISYEEPTGGALLKIAIEVTRTPADVASGTKTSAD